MSFPNSHEGAQPAAPETAAVPETAAAPETVAAPEAPAAQIPAAQAPAPQYAPPQYAQPQYAQPHYAQPQYAPQPPMQQAPVRAPMSGLAIATFVVSFFAGLPAVIMGVFALRQIWVREMRGTGLAWAGIIIGAIGSVLQVSFFILTFLIGASTAVS